jgi:hypothetical protein
MQNKYRNRLAVVNNQSMYTISVLGRFADVESSTRHGVVLRGGSHGPRSGRPRRDLLPCRGATRLRYSGSRGSPPGWGGAALHRDDNLSASVPGDEISEGVGNLDQRVSSVDHGRDLSTVKERGEGD